MPVDLHSSISTVRTVAVLLYIIIGLGAGVVFEESMLLLQELVASCRVYRVVDCYT